MDMTSGSGGTIFGSETIVIAEIVECPVRCQWLICRGYDRGKQCGNNSITEIDGWELCSVHVGLYKTFETCCCGSALLVSIHGKWRDRKRICRVCGKKVW